jgi:hypothetical protein
MLVIAAILRGLAIGGAALILASPVILGAWACCESFRRWRHGRHA